MAEWRANRITSRFRAVGGKLSVDGDRLVFRPHAIDRALFANEWNVALADVTVVEVADREIKSNVFGAGLRKQLRVALADGTEARFVVNRVEQVAAELGELIA
jgi:hypothetical protein